MTHLIPAQDKILEIKWSPDPNIIAVVENGNRRKQVTVWKLFDDHIEAIDVIPGTGLHVAWSPDGLLLSVQNDEAISFVDLSKGNVFAHPNFGIKGEMSDRPWSRDGRYFATSVAEGVKIWDLEERKLLHVFTGKKYGRFLVEGNQVAVGEDHRKWEIWDLDSFIRVRTIEAESDWLKFWPDPQFRKMVIVTDEAEMTVRDIETGETARCNLEFDSFIVYRPPNVSKEQQRLRYINYMKLNWAPGGKDFVCDIVGNVVISNVDRAPEIKVGDLAKLQSMGFFARSYLPIGSGGRSLGFDLLHDSQTMVYHNESQLKKLGAFSSVDLADMTYSPPTEVSIYSDGAIYRVSSDEKMVAIVGSDKTAVNGVMPREWSADMRKVHICSLESGKLVKTLQQTGDVHDVLWTPDSKSLIVSVFKSMKPDLAANFRLPVQKIIEAFDTDGDGKLSKSELDHPKAERMRKRVVDKDGDSFISLDEHAEYYANANSKCIVQKKFSELETKIVNVESGVEVTLEAKGADGNDQEGKLCFQRGGSNWSFAKPLLHQGQIVLPLFDARTFTNGQRTIKRKVDEFHKDKLGFFDSKTGKLNQVIELNCEFKGNRLSVSRQMIVIGLSSRPRNSSVDSFIVFDRLKENRAFAPTKSMSISPTLPIEQLLKRVQKSSRLEGLLSTGTPFLSQAHPFVAVSSKGKFDIWKLDSGNSTFNCVKSIRVSQNSGRGLVEPLWHPKDPTVAWIEDGVVNYFRADTEQMKSYGSVAYARGIAATPDGWLIVGSSKMVFVGRDFKTRKTWLPTERLTSYEEFGRIDQSVSSSGETTNAKSDANMRVIQLRDNRIETKPVSVLKEARK